MNAHPYHLPPGRHTPLATALALIFGSLACPLAGAASIPVTNCNDAGSGSLRSAIASAQSGDTIDLSSLTCNRIDLASGQLTILANDLQLQGPSSSKLTIAGTNAAPVLSHAGVGTLQIDALRIADGGRCIETNGTLSFTNSVVTGCFQSGIKAEAGLTMRNSTVSNNSYTGVLVFGGDTTISGSTISANLGGYCGGLYAGSHAGTVRIENTTISGNKAAWAGCIAAANLTIANSTIAFNPMDCGQGNGCPAETLVINSPKVTLESTIFANNSSVSDLVVSTGTVIDGHNNLVTNGAQFFESGEAAPLPADTLTADPKLQPLADNGGPTFTHALGAGSPAIDAGSNSAGLMTDQRGYPRQQGARPDIGAFEVQSSSTQASGMIGPAYTGSWYDPAQSGHGLAVEVLNGNQFLAYWFTFSPDGTRQAWFLGVGTYIGNTATVTTVDQPAGGRWIPNFDPNKVVHQPWGKMTFTFTDCNHGRVDFNSAIAGYGSGHMDLTRLTQPAGLSCP
ncbi:MAG: right-handed parallel beta-helix repeat-containing protein [Proteobacteria bacterium]|nr:right-handed parallel beta-helix repeat-containing protein [Pseudomonadota bacterium]